MLPEKLRAEADNPAAALWHGFVAAHEKKWTWQEYLQWARNQELAEAATAESVAALVSILGHFAAEQGQAALLLAAAIEFHASTLDDVGQPKLALPLYDAARPVFVEHAAPKMLADFLYREGFVWRHLFRFDEAVSAYDRAIEILHRLVAQGREELENELARALVNKGNALQGQGRLAEKELDPQQAQPIFAAAAAVYEKVSQKLLAGDELRRYHSGYADVLWKQGRRPEALEHLARARLLLRQARRLAGIDETVIEYVAEREGFIDMCVRYATEHGRYDDAFAAVQDGKATVLGDIRDAGPGYADEPDDVLTSRNALTECLRHQRGGLENLTERYFTLWQRARYPVLGAPTEREAREDAPPDRAAIQQHLLPHWGILDFWRLDNESIHVFALTSGELAVHKLELPIAKLEKKYRRFMEAIANPLEGGLNDQILYDLDAYLFAPLRPWLREREIRGLYLVPHGFLHSLPLHAARSGDAYLGDEFDIAYLPSAAMLPHLPVLRLNGPLFSLSNPERGTPQTLPFSDWEGNQLRQRYAARGGLYRLGGEAGLATTEEWSEAALVHFSCHGSGHPGFAPLSHLRLADDLLLAHDVTYRRPPLRQGSLVVLNGCQTSVRDRRAHDEGMGLMSAFLLRGAGLVFATQWSVVDGCAAEVVLHFLEEVLRENEGQDRPSPTAALRSAVGRARRMTIDDLLHRWEDVKKLFPPDSVEHGKMCAQKAWLCLQAGRGGDALQFAELAQVGLRRVGMGNDADRLLHIARTGAGSAQERSLNLKSFDHPVFWSAFQLVGRVT